MQRRARIALPEAAVGNGDPVDVVGTVTKTTTPRWSGHLLLPAVGLLLVVVGGIALAIGENGGVASHKATARAAGLTYDVGIVRTIRLDGVRLSQVGGATQNGGFRTVDDTAYRVDDVDPTKVLVMRLVPGQTDDTGPVGNFLMLTRGEDGYRLTCPYFETGDPIAPTDCR